MEGQEDKKLNDSSKVTAAIEKICQTEEGVIFFRWLKSQCHFDRSIISGNPATYEVNTLGSIAQEFQRTIYLKVRRAFTRNAKIKIELE